MAAASARSLNAAEQLRWRHLQAACDAHDSRQAGIADAPFQPGDFGRMQVTGVGKGLLGELAPDALTPDVARKTLVRLHAAML